jgi:hypothetical protein
MDFFNIKSSANTRKGLLLEDSSKFTPPRILDPTKL